MGMPKLLYEKTIIGKKNKRLSLFGALDFCFCEEEDSVVREMEKIWSRRGLLLLISICIFGWGPCSTSGSTDPADTAALKNLYSSLNSPSWLSHWSLNSDDPCGQSWQGVTCSGSRVTQIVLSGLGLSGSLGFQLTSLTSVVNFDMSNNNLQGLISYQLPPNLQRLNLARNKFNRNIPYSVTTMTSLKYLNVSYNQLQDLYDIFGKLSSLSTLDLSFNSFSGNLPEGCSSLSSMSTMYLQNNHFNGTINVLTNLPLQHLNIENNHFTGWIPERLKNINLQKDGNSFSSGPAPPPPPYWPPSNQYNNADRNHNHNQNQNQNQSDGGGKSGIGRGGIAGIVISLLLVGGIIAAFFLMKRRSRSSSDMEKLNDQPFAPLSSDEVREMKSVQTPTSLNTKTIDASATKNLMPPPIDRHKSLDEEEFSDKAIVVKKKASAIHLDVKSFSVADLQMATNSFSVDNLLGEGSFGRVYRAQFDGKVLAVKKIDSYILPEESAEDFSEIVSKVSQLHHPNVTELVGYCSEHGQHLLVYEFHKNGSLHNFLHLPDEHSKTLTWSCRVNISLGTARALEYLHEVCSPSIVHRNIKSTNILLDSELNPHISDSGLASCMPNIEQVLDHNNAELGYSAPEVTMSGQYTLKSDVYSLGVVMLELLSGREPFDSSRPRAEQSLVRWAAPQLHDIDALGRMVDPALKGLYSVKSLSRFADAIALCVQPEPEFRPPMSEVVQALVRLVQRANMSKRTIGRGSFRGDNPESEERS